MLRSSSIPPISKEVRSGLLCRMIDQSSKSNASTNVLIEKNEVPMQERHEPSLSLAFEAVRKKSEQIEVFGFTPECTVHSTSRRSKLLYTRTVTLL